eukprot:UN28247
MICHICKMICHVCKISTECKDTRLHRVRTQIYTKCKILAKNQNAIGGQAVPGGAAEWYYRFSSYSHTSPIRSFQIQIVVSFQIVMGVFKLSWVFSNCRGCFQIVVGVFKLSWVFSNCRGCFQIVWVFQIVCMYVCAVGMVDLCPHPPK